MPMPLPASSRCSLMPHHHPDAGEGQLGEGERHEDEPGQPLQLVLAQPGPRDPQPDDDDGDDEPLEQGPEPAELVARTGRASRRGRARRTAATSRRCRRTREQEEREPQPGVLGVGAEDDLGVGDRHVERRPLQLGDGGDEEDDGARAAARAATTATRRRRCRTSDSEPAARQTLTRRRAPSAARRTAAGPRRACAPSREYLLALAQPAISVPRMPTAVTARTNTRRAGSVGGDDVRARAGWPPARRGRDSATAGANRKTRRSAAAGVMSSFCTNFTPSATSWAQPWKPPAYIGPSRPCMCAITLCSVWPTSSGSTRKAASTPTAREVDLEASRHRGPHSGSGTPGAGHPAAAGGLACSALARLLGAGPRLGGAGGEHERLAQRGALEAVGQQQRPQSQAGAVVEARRSRARTSRASRARATRRPRKTPVRLGEAGARRDPGAEQDAAQRALACEPSMRWHDDVEARVPLVVGLVDGREPVEEGVCRVARGCRDRRHPVRRGRPRRRSTALGSLTPTVLRPSGRPARPGRA